MRGGDSLALQNEELLDAVLGDVHHFEQASAWEGLAFGGGLDFDEAAVLGHDEIHVDFGLRVFFVGEVEEGGTLDDADAGRGDELAEGRGLEGSGGGETIEGDGECGAGAGDGCGAGTSVGLEDVAVEDDGALAEGLHVDGGAERAADETLDFVGAATDFAAFGFARGAGEGGAWKHAVFGGDPAAAAVAEPDGNALLDGCVAEDPGVSDFDEDGALGHGGIAGGEADGAHLVRLAAGGAEESGLCHWPHCTGRQGAAGWRGAKVLKRERRAAVSKREELGK